MNMFWKVCKRPVIGIVNGLHCNVGCCLEIGCLMVDSYVAVCAYDVVGF